jgi:murein L,D-transpeptidase YafK
MAALPRIKVAVAGIGAFLLLATAPAAQAGAEHVGYIGIEKSKRLMLLLEGDRVVRRYHVALVRHPLGAKGRKGDGRTPEGTYTIDRRNAHSDYFRSLHLDYPNAADLAHARRLHVNPGSNNLIHGIGPYKETRARVRKVRDWTAGCIAVTDAQMKEIWRLVHNGTRVRIVP